MDDHSVIKAPLVCSQRLTLVFLTFFGKFLVSSARINLSLALLCMVRSDVNSNITSKVHQPLPMSSGNLYNTTRIIDDVHFDGISTSQQPRNGSIIKTQIDYVDDGYTPLSSASSSDDELGEGEFDWNKSQQSHLLSMYFYGYILTQVLGGWLSSRFGGKNLWGISQLISSICTILTPVSARTHLYLACAVRFILGFVAGVTFPSVHTLMGKWAPPLDRSKMVSISYTGMSVGTVLTLVVSGFLCEYGLDNGWGSIFYLCGICNLIWVVLWFWLAADSPAQNKRISERERNYIQNSIGKGVADVSPRVPWVKILSSGPLWAIIIANFSTNYFSYTMLTSLPMFIKEAMKFDIKQNGVLSSLPYLAHFVGSIVAGYMADKVVQKRWLTVTTTRKVFQFTCLTGIAVLFVAVVQLDSSQRNWAVLFLCLGMGVKGLEMGGYTVNDIDLAPRYAGLLFGIANTAGSVSGIITPLIAGALTPNKTAEEWSHVFYVCAAVGIVGAFAYVFLADGQLQSWAASVSNLNGDAVVAEENILRGDGQGDGCQHVEMIGSRTKRE